MWEVFKEYDGSVLFTFDTEKEALECCEFYIDYRKAIV